MKKFLLSIIPGITIIFCHPVNAQQEFAPVGAEWYYDYGYGVAGVGYEHFFVEKDSVYKEKVCRKVSVTRYFYTGEIREAYSFYLYEEDEKIFYSYRDTFYILFDFNLDIGDTIKYAVPYDYTFPDSEFYDSITIQLVDSIGQLEVNGSGFRKYWLSEPILIDQGSGGFFNCFTERIGGCEYFFPYEWNLGPDLFGVSFRCYFDYELDIRNIYGRPCDTVFSILSINQSQNMPFKLWINNNTLNIETNNIVHFNNQFNLTIYSINGMVINDQWIHLTNSMYQLELNSIPKGIYIVTLRNESDIFISNKIAL